ncbi:MAG: IS3 family transposase, partial [Candidatus Caenarcaniphilales bacterium]|nr:IS3 family transposase [Candidatus Caenarcaniphilales bacterium]MDX1920147.1 IS3 family transposase [Candidatus Caenarcaniphilales bacterium]
KPNDGLIFHSNRGSQYASHRFQRLLKTFKVNQSMKGKGNRHDYALTKSFFGKIETEYINHQKFISGEEARFGIFLNT